MRAVVLSAVAIVGCGPFVFGLLAVVLVLPVAFLPSPVQGYVAPAAFVLAAILATGLMITAGVQVDRRQREKGL